MKYFIKKVYLAHSLEVQGYGVSLDLALVEDFVVDDITVTGVHIRGRDHTMK